MPSIHTLVPMLHAHDIDRTIDFYALLGFAVKDRMKHEGRVNWAWLQADDAALMLAGASGPIDPHQQAAILYLYTQGVDVLRKHLLATGLTDGGDFNSYASEQAPATSAVFDITRPFYMPKGELRVHDPDGYCLLIGDRAKGPF